MTQVEISTVVKPIRVEEESSQNRGNAGLREAVSLRGGLPMHWGWKGLAVASTIGWESGANSESCVAVGK